MAKLEEMAKTGGAFSKYDDFLCGSEYLLRFQDGEFKKHDTALMFSIDGAQLY